MSKITYGDKTAVEPQVAHGTQWWADDANEVKDIVNENDTVDTSTSATVVFDRIQGYRHGTWTTPITTAITLDTTDAVEGGCAVVIWYGSSNPTITGGTIQSWSGVITSLNTYSIYIHYLNGRFNVNTFNVEGATTFNKGLQYTAVADQLGKGTLNSDPSGSTITIEMRVKMDTGGALLTAVMGVGISTTLGNADNAIIWHQDSNVGRFRIMIGDGVSSNYNLYYDYSADGIANYHTYKLVVNTDGAFEFFDDGVSKDSDVTTTGGIGTDLSTLYVGTNGVGSKVSAKFQMDWLKINNETFEMNEGVGTTTTGDDTTVLTLTGSPTWISI